MTETLFRDDAYMKDCEATVASIDEDSIVLNRTVFYPLGGGQPGDIGSITWGGNSTAVIDTRYGDAGAIRHIVNPGSPRPAVGSTVRATIDWERRYRHMRMHTALHLLGAVLRYGVTGGNIGA